VGDLFYRAFRAGARFDSWEELVQRDLWRTVLAEADWDVEAETCRPRDPDAPLPWSAIQLGVSTSFLRREYKKALAGQLTAPCCPDCRDLCGVCGKNASVRELTAAESPRWDNLRALHAGGLRQGKAGRVLFSFSKQGKAVYLSHLNVMQIFERALLRAGYQSVFTQGYNPKPRIEFAQPLSLGIASEGEIALAELQNFNEEEAFISALNPVLPEGIEVTRARYLPPYQTGQKKHSLMSLYRGSEYRIELRDPACGDPSLLKRLEAGLRQPETSEPPSEPLVQAVGRASVQVGEQTVGREPDHLLLRVEQTGKGSGNIFKVLQSFGIDGEARSNLAITRIRQFAEAIDGPEAAVSYFDLDF
jgi:radical SAM-linked protein